MTRALLCIYPLIRRRREEEEEREAAFPGEPGWDSLLGPGIETAPAQYPKGGPVQGLWPLGAVGGQRGWDFWEVRLRW